MYALFLKTINCHTGYNMLHAGFGQALFAKWELGKD